jgi:hypothetical protein
MLLSRNDLRVRWALTQQEADAVVNLTKCGVVITREHLAKAVLATCAKADRAIATIVLLEPDHWASWREYFEAGATSVLQANATDQLLDAMSDATGLSFRTAARIPFKTEVRFALGDEGGSWRSLNLSASGICLVDFPPYALGSEVDLAFDIGTKSYEFNAMVSQILRVGQRRAVGLAFRDLSPELQTQLDELIRTAQMKIRPVTEPVEEFDALDESTILALRSSNVQGDALALMRALTTGGKVARADTAAPWLVAACDNFTKVEVDAVRNPTSSPAWAQDAVLARLRVFQARAKAGPHGIPTDTEVREIFGLCQRLAETATGADPNELVQVANVRAEILRALYNPELLEEQQSP